MPDIRAITSAESVRLSQRSLEVYIDALRREGRPAPKAESVRRKLRKLYDALPDDKIVTRERLQRWRAGLVEGGLSPRTAETYITAVNGYLRYLGQDELRFTSGRASELGGRRFGHLTAVEPVKRRTAARGIFWRCVCDCGRETEAPASQLLNGNYTSCGCRRGERLIEHEMYVENTCLRRVLSDTIRSDNTSGCTGVYPKRGKWTARIQYKGKIYRLGVFERKEDAIRARKKAEARVKDDAERLLAELTGMEAVG